MYITISNGRKQNIARKPWTRARLKTSWASCKRCLSRSNVKELFRAPIAFSVVDCNTLLFLGLFPLSVSSPQQVYLRKEDHVLAHNLRGVVYHGKEGMAAESRSQLVTLSSQSSKMELGMLLTLSPFSFYSVWEPLKRWFSVFLRLPPFNTDPHGVVAPSLKLFVLLLQNCNFAAATNHNEDI